MSHSAIDGIDAKALVERVGHEIASLPNALAWAEILPKLRVAGCTGEQSSKVQAVVWSVRKGTPASALRPVLTTSQFRKPLDTP